ncbi:hypothetical protein BH11VER1_BH11VER1_31480 [soil metagenome]
MAMPPRFLSCFLTLILGVAIGIISTNFWQQSPPSWGYRNSKTALSMDMKYELSGTEGKLDLMASRNSKAGEKLTELKVFLRKYSEAVERQNWAAVYAMKIDESLKLEEYLEQMRGHNIASASIEFNPSFIIKTDSAIFNSIQRVKHDASPALATDLFIQEFSWNESKKQWFITTSLGWW